MQYTYLLFIISREIYIISYLFKKFLDQRESYQEINDYLISVINPFKRSKANYQEQIWHSEHVLSRNTFRSSKCSYFFTSYILIHVVVM